MKEDIFITIKERFEANSNTNFTYQNMSVLSLKMKEKCLSKELFICTKHSSNRLLFLYMDMKMKKKIKE